MSKIDLELISDPKNADLDVVFIHGPFGNRRSTWTKDGIFWPEEFLSKDFEKARIFTYGYSAEVTEMDFFEEITALEDKSRAKDVLEKLSSLRSKSGTPRNNLIFITHSLGGLVCAQAIQESISERSLMSQVISMDTAGLVFFGTPFRDSTTCSVATILKSMASITMSNETDGQKIDDLGWMSRRLTTLAESLSLYVNKQKQAKKELSTIFFHETLAFDSGVLIVPEPNSWVLGIGESFSVDANHQDICKFTTRDSQYQILRGVIEKSIPKKDTGQTPSRGFEETLLRRPFITSLSGMTFGDPASVENTPFKGTQIDRSSQTGSFRDYPQKSKSESLTHSASGPSGDSDDSWIEPNATEKAAYYHGLPSKPRLVARSSRQKWSQSPKNTKSLSPVKDKAVNDKWNVKLQEEIIEELGEAKWTSVDLLRIGFDDKEQTNTDSWPIVLWIGVEPDSMDWSDAQRVIKGCLERLSKAGLQEVECEIRESNVVQTVSQTGSWPAYLTSAPECLLRWQKPLAALPGQGISSQGSPTIVGTLGIYLTGYDLDNEQKDRKRFALTCRHVVIPESEPPKPGSRSYRFNKATTPRNDVLLPTDNTMTKISLLKTWQDGSGEGAGSQVQNGKELGDTKLEDWRESCNRIMGHVVCAPPIEAAKADQGGFVRDWALIEIDEEKFKHGPLNIVDITAGFRKDILEVNGLLNHSLGKPSTLVSESSILVSEFGDEYMGIQDILGTEELEQPNWEDNDGDRHLPVCKRGHTSGVTWGKVSSTVSIIKVYEKTSRVWPIVALDKRFAPFSKKGDSGSMVFDCKGRVVGMIHRGSGLSDTLDITYTTPMAWLKEDIERYKFKVYLDRLWPSVMNRKDKGKGK